VQPEPEEKEKVVYMIVPAEAFAPQEDRVQHTAAVHQDGEQE
jgi:hypothetical protein